MDVSPSVRSIRAALDDVPEVMLSGPSLEDSAAGSDPGAPIQSFDPDGDGSTFEYSGIGPKDGLGRENAEVPDQPAMIFEIPPSLTDSDIRKLLGDGPGELMRRAQVKGIDALGWYVNFHQRTVQHGIYIPIEGLFALALGALAEVALPFERKLEIAYQAILRHELFHFETDCMAANWELSLGIPVYRWVKEVCREGPGHRDLEEALANAYMLRAFRHPNSALRDERGAYQALKAFCERQPPGYCDGPRYARSRSAYIDGCRNLSINFQHGAALYGGDWQVPANALDTLIFYPNPFRINWRRCPILVHDQDRILQALGISLNFFEAISAIIESPSFLKALGRIGGQIEALWQHRKAELARSTGLKSLAFQRWRPGGQHCYSVRVDGNYRAHLRHDPNKGLWLAERIGDHKSMGHG